MEAEAPEGVDEAEGVRAIGDAKIPSDLAFLQIHGGDCHHDLHLILQLHEHADLGVRVEPGQHPGGVMVVKELAAELQVQLAAELVDSGANMLGLHLQVFLVVEAKSFDHNSPFLSPFISGFFHELSVDEKFGIN